jgi:hypothetical protein
MDARIALLQGRRAPCQSEIRVSGHCKATKYDYWDIQQEVYCFAAADEHHACVTSP